MHALLVSVSIDPAKTVGALEQLRSQVVPAVKQSPGLVAGYWFSPKEAGATLAGWSVVVFDSEESARKAEEMAKSAPLAPGVQFTGFEIREVVAHT